MKFYIGGKHIKTIPGKYRALDVEKCLSDYDRKRLQPYERTALEKLYARKLVVEELSKSCCGKISLDILKEEPLSSAAEKVRRDGKKYYVVRAPSGKEIKADHKIYRCFQPKIEFRNY